MWGLAGRANMRRDEVSDGGKAVKSGRTVHERREDAWYHRRHLGRSLRALGASSALILMSLSVGVVGYRHVCGFGWVDAVLNAAMILTGMGPVDRMESDGAKLFAAFYALFSGVVFVTAAGLLVAPIFHRVLHRFHLDRES